MPSSTLPITNFSSVEGSRVGFAGQAAAAFRVRGGAAIERECYVHGPVNVGEAAITGAGELHARHVIHAASMQLGGRTTAESLRSSMDHAFRLAREPGVRT